MTKEKLQELLHKIEMGYFCKKDCFECYNRTSLHFSCIHVAEKLEKELQKDDEKTKDMVIDTIIWNPISLTFWKVKINPKDIEWVERVSTYYPIGVEKNNDEKTKA